MLLGSIGSTPGIELLSPIPALASFAALKDTATHNAGSARCAERIPRSNYVDIDSKIIAHHIIYN